jgi:regulatory protein
LLAAREHSRGELARKLLSRGHSDVEVESVLADLDALGLVSDARMVQAYVAERLDKGFGPLRVRRELRQRGVADELIDPHLNLGESEWLRRLARAHDRKFGAGPAADSREVGRRARFLEYRGFPSDLIGRFLFGDDGS